MRDKSTTFQTLPENRANCLQIGDHEVGERIGICLAARIETQMGIHPFDIAAWSSHRPGESYHDRADGVDVVDALQATEHPNHLFALGESKGAGIALQSAAVEPRIEAVVAESAFANLTEAAYDYAGLRRYPWLGKTLLAPGAWLMVYRGASLAGFPAAQVAPEKSVAGRAFPVLLICDADDDALPCRHTERIYAAASGPKELWKVPHAFHTAALGYQPAEFRHRIVTLYDSIAKAQLFQRKKHQASIPADHAK